MIIKKYNKKGDVIFHYISLLYYIREHNITIAFLARLQYNI